MARFLLPAVRTRTTDHGDGTDYMVVTGQGTTPDEALERLAAAADAQIRAALDPGRWKKVQVPDVDTWGIEVVGVRLAPDGDEMWTAYGTLRTTGEDPFEPAD
jgi:hypothetical protein